MGARPPAAPRFPGYAVTALAADPAPARDAVWVGLTGVVKGGLLARSTDGRTPFDVVRRWEDRAGARVVARRCRGPAGASSSSAATAASRSRRTTGATWRASAPPLDPGSGISFVAFHPLRPERSLLRLVPPSLPLGRTAAGRGRGSRPEWWRTPRSSRSTSRRTTPDDFWAATCGWVYRTTDGGANWTRYREGLADRRTHVVRMDPRDPSRILAGTTGGLFESRDRGKTLPAHLGRRSSSTRSSSTRASRHASSSATEADGVLGLEDGGVTLDGVEPRPRRGARLGRRGAAVGAGSSWRAPRTGAAAGSGASTPRPERRERLARLRPSTVLAPRDRGERLLAATPDGDLPRRSAPGAPFAKVLGLRARAIRADGAGRSSAATDAGVFESPRRRDALVAPRERSRSRVEDVRRVRALRRRPFDVGGRRRRRDGLVGRSRVGRGGRCPAAAGCCPAVSAARASPPRFAPRADRRRR